MARLGRTFPNRQHQPPPIVGAGSGPPPLDPTPAFAQRFRQAWRTPLQVVRRGRISTVVPPQLNPPYPFNEVSQPRRARNLNPRRGHRFDVVPPQDAPVTEVVQPHRQRGFTRRRQGRTYETVPPQFNPPYPFSELKQPRQPRGMRSRRGRMIEVVPQQQAAIPNPAFTTNVTQPRQLRGTARQRRGRMYEVVPPQLNPPYPFSELAQPRRPRAMRVRRGHLYELVPLQDAPVLETTQPKRLRGLTRQRRGRLYEVVPPQLNPPYLFTEIAQPRRIRLMRVRRSSLNQYVPDQQAAIPNPAFTTFTQQSRHRYWILRRSKITNVVPAQLNPVYPFAVQQQSRHRHWILRRGKRFDVVPPQPQPVEEQHQPRRPRAVPQRRGRITVVVQPQLNPPIVFVARQPRRLRGFFRWRKRSPEPPWPQAVAPDDPMFKPGPLPF